MFKHTVSMFRDMGIPQMAFVLFAAQFVALIVALTLTAH